MPKNSDLTCQDPTESKLRFSNILENIFARSSPCGCFVLSTNWFSLRITSNIAQYLFEPDLISSAFSSKYSSKPLRSTNAVNGINFLLWTSSKTYVPAPQAKWIESSYFGFLLKASITFVRGMHDGTGNHASDMISPLVCSSIRSIQSGIVILYFSRSFFVILPVNDTGWKLTAWTTSKFLCAYRTIPPSSWSFIDLITVGTNTTVIPHFLADSRAYGTSQWFLGFVLGLTPSNDR